MQTIQKLLNRTAKRQTERLDAELILAHSLGKTREWIIAHPEHAPPLLERWRFKRNVSKRMHGLPLAYITGYKTFFGLNFVVNKYTLIPRPETELLVEETLNIIKTESKNIPKKNTLLIDIGTGSGCIPISILESISKTLGNSENNQRIATIATDISGKALKIAKKNQKKHATKIKFIKQNLLPPASVLVSYLKKTDLILITANLPYLSEEQWNSESSIKYEPKAALVAPDQGLGLYKNLFRQIVDVIQKDETELKQKKIYILCEIGPCQSARLTTYIKKIIKNADIKIKKDLSGLERCFIIRIDKKLCL
ncbi:MAG: peptide chain release factor N(5)-glutamine methyltransferase [Candidatus Magasanikbacteria bacterium]|nr:peptide chain release factor N(5)-glutamine methyltransferase [Candidatus Magasanikbacteria bacterium]